MSKARLMGFLPHRHLLRSLPILHTLLFFILYPCILSLLFPPCVGHAGVFSKKQKTEKIVEKYGDAVVLIAPSDKDGNPLGVGSGFIVDPDGIVVTNYHCISGAVYVWVRLTNGAHYQVEGVLGVDLDWDAVVLKVKAKNLPITPIGDSNKLSAGEGVVAIGNPLGLENTVSEGIISAIRSLEGTGGAIIQFTAPISPGSSGGPLFNTKGKVVGMITLLAIEGQNINFAVPINLIKPLLKDKKLITLAEAAREPKAVSPPSTIQRPSGSTSQPSIPTEEDVISEAQRHFDLGSSFLAEAKLDSAISEFQEAIRLRPDYAEAHYELAGVYAEKGQYDLAIRPYEEAIGLRPDYAEAYNALGWVYAEKGQYDLAMRYCEEAVRLRPDYPEGHYELATVYNEKGLYDLALTQYEEALRLRPDYAEVHNALGHMYVMKDQYDLAIRQYEEAIRLRPDYAEAHLTLGGVYFAKGQYDLAIRHCEEAVRLRPDYAEAHYELGLVYVEKGQYDLAIRHYEETVRLRPDYVEAHHGLGGLYFAKGQYDLAIRHCGEAIRLRPDYAEAHYHLGMVYGEKGQYDLAIKHCEEALRIKPDLKEARELLDALYKLKERQ